MPKSIRLALSLIFVLLSLLAAGQGIVSIVKLLSIRSNISEVASNWLPSIDVINRINTITADYRILQFRLVTNSSDSTSLAHNITTFRQKMEDLANARGEYEPMVTSGEERQAYDAFSALWTQYQEDGERIVKLMQAGKKDEAFALLTSDATTKLYNDSGALLDQDVAVNKRGGVAAVGNTMGAVSSTVLVTILAMALATTTGIIALLYCIRKITDPISRLTTTMGVLADGNLDTEVPFAMRADEIGKMSRAVEVFKQNSIKARDLNAQEAALQAKSADLQSSIAEVVSAAVAGDFTHRITKKYGDAALDRFAGSVNELVTSVDRGIAETRRVISALADGDLTENMCGEFQGAFGELKSNVNATMAALRSVLGEVRSAVDTINGGAGEMRIASGDLSKRTEQQAAALEETSSALEEITVAVKSSTERATEASHMVDEARRSTEQSSAVVKDAVAAMGRIEQASDEIGQIINVIDEIAFQTNLLALNAGVEAARAGDAGKGFAVVAQEVRELAQRSATAAKDIKALINRSGDEVKTGVRLVTATGDALGLIRGHVIKVNEHVHTISTAAREQSTGLAEVSTAVNQMDQTTQQNAAMVEESTAATNRLADEASNLARLIARFRLDGSTVVRRVAHQNGKPAASPARALSQKLAGAFGGRTTAAVATKEWEEF
ncbi:methyl-accepting chemotaxis protein [Rhizobium aethiopicum]|uniref:Methyl-accepting chemotaxis protein n=2 Tax=Rhizobium TaxID=379 RepID=Q8KL21_RHIEC|nr:MULTISPECIES: methyl-accepting chemotaxis protein [Rhizobium]AAM54953.1 methyl-accepting chemotaxis protein [Rhizobium etli CFN 42]MBB4195751.1 methyl-accepting chemotaxis protein [Rhizobium aethiopicum]MBB4583450.1 methyl-accepting chemotaxis protein [Rhizobium aethiopicum]